MAATQRAKSTLQVSTLESSGSKAGDGSWAAVQYDVGAVSTLDNIKQKVQKARNRWSRYHASFNWLDWLSFFVPCVGWLRSYQLNWLIHDLVAGISVGAMVVPQGMSYATTAGLPSVYGLYGAFLPCMVYGLVGSSRQLAVGPVAVTSLLISTNLNDLLPCHQAITNFNQPPAALAECQAQYNRAAIQVAFIVACMYTGIGVLRLGWITKFLSHPVIGGFTSGAAIIIGLGQFKYIMGYNIKPSNDRLNLILKQYFDLIWEMKWQEFCMGMIMVTIMLFFTQAWRVWKPLRYIRSFGPITCCIAGLVAVKVGNLGNFNIRLVGTIPKGLPGWTGDVWTPMDDPSFGDLFPIAIVVMFVDLLESTSIARALARKNGYELVYNREIIGLGLANFAGAMSNCYTTTGSFSRSAVNNQAGAKTPLSQFVCSWVVGFVLLFLTGVFQNLPMNVLGAIICVSIAQLFEYEQAIYLWKVNKFDLLCWLASFLGTLFYSVEVGLAIAIGLAVLLAMFHTAFPHIVRLGQVPGTRFHRNLKQFPDALITPGLLQVRVDAPLYYANVTVVQDKVESMVKSYEKWSQEHGAERVRYIVWDLTPVLFADSMGLHLLEDLVLWTREREITLLLANPCKSLAQDWSAIDFPDLVGREHLFLNVHDAVSYAKSRLVEQGVRVEDLPLNHDSLSEVSGTSSPGSPGSSSPRKASKL